MPTLTIVPPRIVGERQTLSYVDGATLETVLVQSPTVLEAITTETGEVTPFVRLYLDDEPTTLTAPLPQHDCTLTIMSGLSGG